MGYLIKQTSVESVCNAILEVHQGNIFFSPSIPKRLHKRNQKNRLIKRDLSFLIPHRVVAKITTLFRK